MEKNYETCDYTVSKLKSANMFYNFIPLYIYAYGTLNIM